MTTFDRIERHPDRRTLAAFRGILLGGGLAVAALLRFVAHRPSAALVVASLGAGVALLSLVPRLGPPLYVGWMRLGVAIGLVTSPVVLGLVWILVITPVAIAMRLAGRDPMKRRWDPAARSGWEPHPPPGEPRRYFRQF